MRRVMGNFAFLVKGRGVAAVLLFANATLMARALGPIDFGMVVLIQTYALLTRGLLGFQLFDAIVRYGVPALDANDNFTIRRLLRVCWRVDVFSSAASTLIAFMLAPIVGPLMGMQPNHVVLLTAYSLVLLASTGNGTSIGVLRLFDQFDTLGKQMTIGPAVRFLGIVIAWWFDSPLVVFMAILAFGSITEDLYLNWFGWREYQKRLRPKPDDGNLKQSRMAHFPGLKHFLWVSYWQSNIDLVPKHASIMMAGYLLGSAEAGLLRLARQFSSLLSKPADLIRQVVFLDLTRSWNQGNDAFKTIAYRTALLGLFFGLLFVAGGYFFGDDLLEFFVGKEYVAAAQVLTLMLLAGTFDLASSSLRSAAYAMGHAANVLKLYGISAFVYLSLFIVLAPWFGLISAGIAISVAAAIPPLAMFAIIRKGSSPATNAEKY